MFFNNVNTDVYQEAAKRYRSLSWDGTNYYISDRKNYDYEDYDTRGSQNQAIQLHEQQSSFMDYIVEGRH